MKSILSIFYCLALVAFFACAPSKKISTQKADSYQEDISVHRINYIDSLQANNGNTTTAPVERTITSGPVTTQYAITDDIDAFLKERSVMSATKNSYEGFTLQVYTGGSRNEANAAKRQVYDALPEARPAISYNSSIYRVRVGEYASRLAAQADYARLQKEFSNVLLVPQKFKVN